MKIWNKESFKGASDVDSLAHQEKLFQSLKKYLIQKIKIIGNNNLFKFIEVH